MIFSMVLSQRSHWDIVIWT